MTRPEPRSAPGDAPVVTGSGDDGRRRLLQLVIGLLGWAFLIALVWYLASHASVAAVDLAIVFVTAITIVAIFSTVTAVQLRARLIDQRANGARISDRRPGCRHPGPAHRSPGR